jgi:hypothetical protein
MKSPNVHDLIEALKPFIEQARPNTPEGEDPTLWVQLSIKMEWLHKGYLALHPEKEEEMRHLADFYSFVAPWVDPPDRT